MSYPIYYVEAGDTLPHLFASYDGATGASEALSGLAVTDIEVYKDGSATQRASDAGYALLDTDGIDFDGITGINGFSLDLSDNTDAGFYAVGSWYHVVVASVTVDGQTVNFVACAFRIVSATRGMAGTALPDAAAEAAGGLPISTAGTLALDTKLANTAEITAARMGALTDWINGGRLDLLLDECATTAEVNTATGNFGGSGLIGNTVSASTAELGAGASATSDLYNGMTLVILSGTGVGQSRIVTDYDGATKVASVSPNWTTTPAENDTYILIGTPPAPILTGSLPRVDIREWLGTAVATPAVAGRPSVDTIAVSGDTTAADNLEAACDGTTYNIGGGAVVAASVTGAVGSVTGAVGSVTGAVGSVTGAVGSVTGAVGSVTGNVGGNVTGSVGSLAAQAKADVNAEVVDALATDTYAEPGQGAPAATATLAAKLNYLYKAWRNKKVQDATTWELYADNASTVDQKAAVSDDGTDFTVGEIASGA